MDTKLVRASIVLWSKSWALVPLGQDLSYLLTGQVSLGEYHLYNRIILVLI